MEPKTRQRWAEAWQQWLVPGGELVTVMFPVEPEGREGPPWPVPTQLYDDTLSPAGNFLLHGQHNPTGNPARMLESCA